MKKITLVIALLYALSLSASAQWYNPLKKHERLPLIAAVKDNAPSRIKVPAIHSGKIPVFKPAMTDFLLEATEQQIMKLARHNMSWRIYDQASYNFSDLAKLYIQQKRMSEAKWYLLQSTTLAQRTNDDRHVIDNLMQLALVKADMGDIVLAQQDLAQACDLATVHNWNDNVAAIEKEVKYIQLNKTTAAKLPFRYADDAILITNKVEKKPVAN